MPHRESELGREIAKRGPFESREQEAYLNLVRTGSRLSNAFFRLFKAHGLSESCYNTLRILRGHHPEALRIKDVGGQLVVPVPDVTRLVNRLVDQGYAARERDTDDRRATRVRITDEGLEKLAELDGPVRAMHRDQLGHLSESELDTLNRILTKARRPPPNAGARLGGYD